MPDPIIRYKTITIVQKKTLSNGVVRAYPAKKTYPLTGYARSDGTRKEKVVFTELQKADIISRAAADVRINRLQADYNCTWAAINKVIKEGEYLAAAAGVTIPVGTPDMGEVCIDASTKILIDGPVVDNPVVDSPVVDNPVVDNQVIDSPVVDNSVADSPVVVNPVVISVNESVSNILPNVLSLESSKALEQSTYIDNTTGVNINMPISMR